jgi:hypothetical protein
MADVRGNGYFLPCPFTGGVRISSSAFSRISVA